MASKLAKEAEEEAMKLLKKAFDDTDADNSGTICAKELRQLFEKAGLQDTTDAEIQVSYSGSRSRQTRSQGFIAHRGFL